MTRARVALAAGLAVLLAAAAATQPAPPSGAARVRVPSVAQQCVACHGGLGQGIPATGGPRIAAQPEYYLAKQLRDYASGRRRNPVMEHMARSLSERDIATLAAFYSRQDAPATSASRGSERGRVLATVGDAGRGVQACVNCHGPDGSGQPPAIPYLAGLDARYQASTIGAWKDGTRRNDGGGQMRTVALALSAEDVAAVSAHYAELQPPAPRRFVLVQAARPLLSTGPAPVASRPAGADDAGVDQGAPTGGATHGEGAGGSETRTGSDAAPAGAGADAPGGAARPAAAPTAAAAAAPAASGNPTRGRAILASGAYGCAGCHSIPGVRRARGVVGPPLGGMARRGFIAGQLPNRPEVLVAFLLDPPALVPRTGMPATGLTRDEALDIAAYLQTLGR